uniref:Uncharacterized protein n=1 Tax=viral metagenome TaxID=1070528 RepID=A0A6C0KNE7_9ZZZZ
MTKRKWFTIEFGNMIYEKDILFFISYIDLTVQLKQPVSDKGLGNFKNGM